MSLFDSLSNISIDEPSLDIFDLYLDPSRLPFHHPFPDIPSPNIIVEENLENSLELAHPLVDTQSE